MQFFEIANPKDYTLSEDDAANLLKKIEVVWSASDNEDEPPLVPRPKKPQKRRM